MQRLNRMLILRLYHQSDPFKEIDARLLAEGAIPARAG